MASRKADLNVDVGTLRIPGDKAQRHGARYTSPQRVWRFYPNDSRRQGRGFSRVNDMRVGTSQSLTAPMTGPV